MDWKQKLLEAHAHDERAWRLSLAVRGRLRCGWGAFVEDESVLVAPGTGGLVVLSERGDVVTCGMPWDAVRRFGGFWSEEPRLSRPVRDARSASQRGRMAMEFRRRLPDLHVTCERLPLVRQALAAADAVYWAFAPLLVPSVRPTMPCAEDAEQELLLRSYQLAMRVDPHAENLIVQARGYARRGLVPLGLRVGLDTRPEVVPLESLVEVSSGEPTPEERVQASEEAQLSFFDDGLEPLAAAVHIARLHGLRDDELAERIGMSVEDLREAHGQCRVVLPSKRYRRCASPRCRRVVGQSGRRGLCQRCYRRFLRFRPPAAASAK